MSERPGRVRSRTASLRVVVLGAVVLALSGCAYDVGSGDPEQLGQATHELVTGDPTQALAPTPRAPGAAADPGDPGGPTPDPWNSLDLDPSGPTPDPWLQSVGAQQGGSGLPADPGADPDPASGDSASAGQHRAH